MGSPHHTLTIEARPTPITIDVSDTAVIVVDMQNDFASVGGAFALSGKDISMIRHTIAPTSRVLAAARETGIRIVYVKSEWHEDLVDLGAVDSKFRSVMKSAGKPSAGPDGQPSRVFIQNTWNTDIVTELTPEPADIIVIKQRFSGFYGTNLDAVLRGLGIRSLIFTGCTTSVCVESTLRDAMYRDYRCLLLSDCTAEPIGHGLVRSNYEVSLLLIERLFGWVSDSTELLAALEMSGVHAGMPTA